MKFRTLLLLAAAWMFSGAIYGQDSPVGVWKTIDDETGEAKSHIEIYEQDGKYVGKVVALLQVEPDKTCDKCSGDKKDQPLMGMELVWDMESYKDYWSYGRIMDPNNGKTYKCSIWLDGPDKLEVRGYLGVSALGRTQSWERVK